MSPGSRTIGTENAKSPSAKSPSTELMPTSLERRLERGFKPVIDIIVKNAERRGLVRTGLDSSSNEDYYERQDDET